MKVPLWYLLVLLACLFTPGRSDCPGECVACGLLLQQQHQPFNTMVCLLECEGHVSPSLTWEVCRRAVQPPQRPSLSEAGALLKRTGHEALELTSLDLDTERLQEGNQEEAPFQQRSLQYDSSLLESAEQQEQEEEEEEGEGLQSLDLDLGPEEEDLQTREERDAQDAQGDEGNSSEAVALSKRFGGFQRGRHGYRKLIGSPIRILQKRYGGFIGVRKSARKWNSQKRVNQLLRQYLGMRSSRSGRFNNIPMTRLWRQNKL